MQKPRRLTGCSRRKCVSTSVLRVGTSGPLVRSSTNGRASRASLPKSAHSKPVTTRQHGWGRPCPLDKPIPTASGTTSSSSLFFYPWPVFFWLQAPRSRLQAPLQSTLRALTATTTPPPRARIPGAPRLPDTTPLGWCHRLVTAPASSHAWSPLWFLRLHLPFFARTHVLLHRAFS
jgi:hypothetical protein